MKRSCIIILLVASWIFTALAVDINGDVKVEKKLTSEDKWYQLQKILILNRDTYFRNCILPTPFHNNAKKEQEEQCKAVWNTIKSCAQQLEVLKNNKKN